LSLVALHGAIKRYLDETNKYPRPFIWTANPEHNSEKVQVPWQGVAAQVSRVE
jgi:hypothetical protein